MSMTPEQIDSWELNNIPSSHEFRRRLAALAKRGLAFDDAVMDCKGYDLFPDGTLRPAHGLGEWVRSEDYDKLHAAAEASIEQRDKAVVALKTIEGHHNENDSWRDIAREALKECGK